MKRKKIKMVHIDYKDINYKDIPLNDLEVSRSQVRLSDVNKDIDELVDSIRKVGLLEPILVAPEGPDGKHEIILGQRRVLAHRLLGLETIKAGILSKRITEIEAKVLSVTENFVRSPLSRKDLTDVCLYLHRRYGSMKDVATETGLPLDKVRQYVRYERLIPELKKAVDDDEVDLNAALRTQDALSIESDPDPQDCLKLAKEMTGMSGAQRKNVQKQLKDRPDSSVDEVVEDAKSGGKVTQIPVTLLYHVHRSLRNFAKAEGITIDEAAAMLIEDGLSLNGYSISEDIE